MPIPGPTVHQQLLDAYNQFQRYLETERDSILHAKDRRDELNQDRGDALDGLAQHYLPELSQEAIAQTWSEVRDGMMQILRRQQEHARRVELELAEVTSRREKLDQQLMQINQAFDQAREQQDQVADKVERQLRADQSFIELSDRAAIAESALERAEANLQEIDQEASRKLPAYDQSSLFRYLYDRGYGSERYTHRGFTRRMDRWLARYIDFSRAKQSYEFLSRTPDQMRQIIAEDREALDTVMSELESRRDRAANENGLPEAIRKTNQIAEERERLLASIDTVLDELKAKQSERDDVEDVRGTYYRDAIRLFRELLDRQEVTELRRRAEKTEEVTDDQLVARLQGVDVAIGRLDEAARQQRAKLDAKQEVLDGLGRVIQRFRAAQFDSARSNFLNALNVHDEVIQAAETGDVDGLWKQIRRAQRWGPIDEEGGHPAAANPMQQILVNAMTQAAGSERSESARRAGDRRAQQRSSSRG